MALKDFMPYGASELLADQDRRMARASASATALLLLVFAALMLFLPRMPIAADKPAEFPSYVLEPPPESPDAPVEPLVPTTPIAPPSAPTAPDHAVPVPVPDAIAPEPVAEPPASSGAGEAGEAHPGTVAPQGGGSDWGTPVESDPVWGTPVIADEYPVLVSSPDVIYPDLAREAGVEGRVIVRMLVGRDGRVKEAVVDPKHSVPLLDAAALASARASVFTPALSNGHAVAVWVARPFDFRLR
ncbi:MAG: TonB family protein [Candidatus Eisenbacteria bacterium]|uniref:TonB family protein n=1 Tax=Eiseniibacteriota bacterium TaxID=2212470 RepID=A0A933S9B0_UNCEI|nr:TonB family protein [Candidatus Eisenbacteria bacterium]